MSTNSLQSRNIVSITALICFSLLLLGARGGLADTYKSKRAINEGDRYKNSDIGFDDQMDCEQWDSSFVQKPGVLWDQDAEVYRMWFDGFDSQDILQIGLATSSDGISWTKYNNNPVMSGTPGAWDESGPHTLAEHAPFVLKENGTYKMWYEGSRGGGPRQLGYAISTNGIDWFKYAGNPVLQAGPEAYDQDTAGHGSVLNDGGTYKLWYHAGGDLGVIIAYATSPDGYTWTKQGPVLLPSATGWDNKGLWGPSVLKLDSVYWMWYSAHSTQESPAIGLATSTNGMDWNRVGTVPVINEEEAIGDPHVLFENGTFKMWYTNFNDGVINYAESDDGVTWSKSPSNPVLTPGNAYCQVFLPLAMLNP